MSIDESQDPPRRPRGSRPSAHGTAEDTIASLLEGRDLNVALVRLSSRLDAIDDDYRDLRSSLANQWKRMDDLSATLSTKIDNIGNSLTLKFEERSRTPWQTYISAALLIGSIFWAFINPIQKAQEVQDSRIVAVTAEHRSFVKEMHDELTRRNDIFVTTKEHNDLKERVKSEDTLTREEIKDLKTSLVRLNERLTKYVETDLREEINHLRR